MVTYRIHQYQVVGRALPTETDEHPKIYRMKLWATNEVRAKSKFWYFLRKLKKVKKSNGQMLAINEIFEKNPTKIKNYGIWLRYQSRTGYHNMYKEYRDTTLNGAVEQMYTEMASRHRVRYHCIQIIKTATIPAKLCKRESTKQFHNSKIKFPLVFKKRNWLGGKALVGLGGKSQGAVAKQIGVGLTTLHYSSINLNESFSEVVEWNGASSPAAVSYGADCLAARLV
ncbi:hypothetical protein TEA_001723 [Camellia sinensis var. sinensis]|uniref:Large ribosomal subunit protein eL20 domain-containing protein n=1 Tax=Camellia sinensis var. sinensis TaxID=542762 RepID=A0A4S4F191_CAMSN|nr:hypothetical protein TEA_001723 [Camellia sinensis var. sinensis]